MSFLFVATHPLPFHKAMVAILTAAWKFKDCGTCMMDLENIIVQEVGWKNSRDNNQWQDTDKAMHFTFYVK